MSHFQWVIACNEYVNLKIGSFENYSKGKMYLPRCRNTYTKIKNCEICNKRHFFSHEGHSCRDCGLQKHINCYNRSPCSGSSAYLKLRDEYSRHRNEWNEYYKKIYPEPPKDTEYDYNPTRYE